MVDRRNPMGGVTAIMSPKEYSIASEKGRQMAALNLILNPQQKKVVEARYGKDFCRRRWPEAYKEN